MKRFFLIIITTFLVACDQNIPTNITAPVDTIRSSSLSTDTILQSQEQKVKRLSFNNIEEIIADSSSSIWVAKRNHSFSLALHFQYKDTLAVSYSPECWLLYPYKLNKNKIVVYWDDNIDTKYEFDIVKAINKTDKKHIGKPFMILELVNDTTFTVNYPIQELIKDINGVSKKRIFFPDTFQLVQEDEMYD